MYKTDLHTHSLASPDGSLSLADYRALLADGLDYIAVTDHDTVEFALHAQQVLGTQIIVGEEVSTQEGEIIGLFLRERIPPGRHCQETARLIHQQGGLVYVPHPMETVRSGLPEAALDKLAPQIDVVEGYNGRAVFQNRSAVVKQWAVAHRLPVTAASDAHGRAGWGRAYTVLPKPPTAQNLPALLAEAELVEQSVGWQGVLYPKWNRLRKGGRHHA
jgi:predicted metal-dependent phosphoesterase TrpH